MNFAFGKSTRQPKENLPRHCKGVQVQTQAYWSRLHLRTKDRKTRIVDLFVHHSSKT